MGHCTAYGDCSRYCEDYLFLLCIWVIDFDEPFLHLDKGLTQLRTVCIRITQILHCLTKYGQRLDSELAKETGVPLAKVRQRLAELAATGAIITCNLTRFENGKRIDALVCRMSGWVPPPAPGRKAKSPA